MRGWTPSRSSGRCSTSTPARRCTVPPSTAETATWPGGGPSGSRATSNREAGPTTRCRSREPEQSRRRRGHRRQRSRWRHRGRRAHRRRLERHRAREGAQSPARPGAAVRVEGRLLQRRDQVHPPPLPRPRPAPRAEGVPEVRRRRRPPAARRGQQPAVRSRRRGRPRRRQDAPVPRAGLPPAVRTRSDRRRRSGRLAARLRRARALLRRGRAPRRGGRRGRRQPVRVVALRALPDGSGARHVRRHPLGRGCDPDGLPPLPGTHGHQHHRLRRPALLQQLRLLWAVRLSDPRQRRRGGVVAQSPTQRALRDPTPRHGHRGRPRRSGSTGPCGALPRRRRRRP